MEKRFPLSLTIPVAILGSYFMYSVLKTMEMNRRTELARHIIDQCPQAKKLEPCTANCIGFASGLYLRIDTQFINWPQNIRLLDNNHDNGERK